MKTTSRLLFALLLFIAGAMPLFSQQTLIFSGPEATYREALDLFTKEKFNAARQKFLEVSSAIDDQNSILRSNAEYYAAVCGFELFNNNSDQQFNEFLSNIPENTKHNGTSLQLGKIEYSKGNFRKASQHLQKVITRELRGKEREEYFFKLAYSYLNIKEKDKAYSAFEKITDQSSVYYSPSEYYMAHIAYENKKYDKALEKFRALSEDAVFKNIVPFYIIQVYFFQEKYDELLEMAPGLMQSGNAKRLPEIARLAAEALYRQKKYQEAIPYYDIYFEKTKTQVQPTDHYQYAYSSYKLKLWDKATEHFNLALNVSDTMSQNAFYHLGDCYIQKNQKKFALNSFYSAYKEGFNIEIKEDALFNYAKLSYELGYNPYNEAIKSLKQYIQEYPDSKRIDEAYTYLVNLFMSTKNYKDALDILDNIKGKNEKLKAVYYRLNNEYAVTLYNNGKIQEAIDIYSKVIGNQYDPGLGAEALYWTAEGHFKLGKYKKSIDEFKQFLTTPGAYNLSYFRTANYNLGYGYFKLKEYDKALTEFRKYINSSDTKDPKILNDAYLRAGDCFFIDKRYDDATVYYEKATKMKMPDGDYALYQLSLAEGAAGQTQAKIKSLEQVLEVYPSSILADEAKYELGLSYLNVSDEANALKAFNRLIKEHPGNKLTKNAMLRIGLIQYNQNENDAALETFRKVVSEYPGTTESKEALVSIRNIYVDVNKVDDFFVYAKSIPFANVSDAEQDSVTYQAAENLYMSGDCNSSAQGFKDYLNKFPKGIFRLNVSFYLAECMQRQNRQEESIEYYQYVVDNPKSRFTETSLLNVSNYYFAKQDWNKALESYTRLLENADNPNNLLTAQNGIMQCNYKLKQYDQTIAAANGLIANEKASAELHNEAHLLIARSALATDQIPLAQTEFATTLRNNKGEQGAEAKYNLAYLQFKLENYKEAEKIIFEFISEFSAYDTWLAKSFILLADVYVKLGNNVQAKQTLQSIIDNYEGPELAAVAQGKLNDILKTEREEAARQKEASEKAMEEELNKESGVILENE